MAITKLKKIFFCIFLYAALTGCSGNAPREAADAHPADTATIPVQKSSHSENNPYSLPGLSIGCSEADVTALYGEPEGRFYEIVGTYGLTEQSLYTHMIYDDKMIVIRDFPGRSENDGGQNGVIEMELRSGSIETDEGIRIGDSIRAVRKKYKHIRVCDYGEQDGLISSLIYNRTKKKDTYKNRDYSYGYGSIDKVAYILSREKYNDHTNIPALIFLLHKGKVTRIIVMNTLQQ